MRISDLRQTHTFVVMDLSPAAYHEIKSKMEEAGYQHTFIERDGGSEILIDMHGIAIGLEDSTRQS